MNEIKKRVTFGYLLDADAYVLLKSGRRVESPVLFRSFSDILYCFPLTHFDIVVTETDLNLTTLLFNDVVLDITVLD